MAIKSSGSLAFSDIRNEFGGLHQPPSEITTGVGTGFLTAGPGTTISQPAEP